jgi:aminomethyltransferase
VLQGLFEGGDLAALGYYQFTRGTVCGLEHVHVSRTGYTGEDGFELTFPSAAAPGIWDALLEAGKSEGIAPIGLGARDVLRLEAGMALYGHELDDTTNPVEAGLITAPIKHAHDFHGRAAIEAVLAAGPERRLVGFTTESKRVPRQGYELYAGATKVGTVCSGSPSPTLGTNIGTAYVASGQHEPGTTLEMDIRGQRHPVLLVPMPFYKKDY